MCYITKSFVDGPLITLLRNDFKIESLKEYGEFLGMSHNPDRLRQLRDWYARAFEIQRPRIDDWSI